MLRRFWYNLTYPYLVLRMKYYEWKVIRLIKSNAPHNTIVYAIIRYMGARLTADGMHPGIEKMLGTIKVRSK
jgi:hypothetical protein